MNWLAENALPIWIGGAIALTMAATVYLQTRTNGALIGVGAVIFVAGLLLSFEHFVETPREAVERTLYELVTRVRENDVPGTLSYLAPSIKSQIRKDVETLMPLVEIERANIIGTPKIELGPGADPTQATVVCRGFIYAVNKSNRFKGGQDDQVTFQFIRDGDRWLIEDYISKKNWHRAMGR